MPRLAIAAVAATLLAACATTADRRAEQAPAPKDRSTSVIATRHPFEVEGKVGGVGEGVLGFARSVTIVRKDAPPAKLAIAEETRITLDDRPARLTDLREGDEVRATFDFDGNTPVLLHLEAKPSKR